MFSSSNPLASSVHGLLPPSSTLFGQEKYDCYFNHHVVAREYCSFDHASPSQPVKEPGLQNCDSGHHQNLTSAPFCLSKKRLAGSKTDRHSKIFTSQGPRSRRVRLSIAISKKFFGLQDLLGFDKASKTLEWLFTKSKTAINDLIKEMKHTNSSSTLSEEVFMEKVDRLDKKGKKKKTTQKLKSGFHVNLASRNQLRAEARSRARQRTIEKMQIKKLDNDVKNVLGDHKYCYLESRRCGNQIQSLGNHEVKTGSLLTERKLQKPYSLLYNSQFKNSSN